MEYEDRAGKVQASSAAVCREHGKRGSTGYIVLFRFVAGDD